MIVPRGRCPTTYADVFGKVGVRQWRLAEEEVHRSLCTDTHPGNDEIEDHCFGVILFPAQVSVAVEQGWVEALSCRTQDLSVGAGKLCTSATFSVN